MDINSVTLQLANRLSHYWSAILQCYPNAANDPKNFWLQKPLGLAVFCRLFPIIDDMTPLPKSESESAYLGVIRKKLKLPRENFWSRTGAARTMGSSYSARTEVVERIFPKIDKDTVIVKDQI